MSQFEERTVSQQNVSISKVVLRGVTYVIIYAFTIAICFLHNNCITVLFDQRRYTLSHPQNRSAVVL